MNVDIYIRILVNVYISNYSHILLYSQSRKKKNKYDRPWTIANRYLSICSLKQLGLGA